MARLSVIFALLFAITIPVVAQEAKDVKRADKGNESPKLKFVGTLQKAMQFTRRDFVQASGKKVKSKVVFCLFDASEGNKTSVADERGNTKSRKERFRLWTKQLLTNLSEEWDFNIISYDGTSIFKSDGPVVASQSNIDASNAWWKKDAKSTGKTTLDAALKVAVQNGADRIVVLAGESIARPSGVSANKDLAEWFESEIKTWAGKKSLPQIDGLAVASNDEASKVLKALSDKTKGVFSKLGEVKAKAKNDNKENKSAKASGKEGSEK